MLQKPFLPGGVSPALVSPFTREEDVDEEAFRRLIRHVLPHVDGLVPCGTTGEFPYLSVAEQQRLVKIAVEEAQGKPVIAGTGAAGTKQAIELAQAIGLPDGASLSINFLPNAVYEPRACIRLTLSAAMRTGLPVERIIFEFTESERIDTDHLLSILRTYRALGFRTAIDDFGTGFASLELVTRFRPDIVKLDMGLVRGIDSSREKRTVLRHTLAMFRDLDVTVTCEGVETVAELDVLCDLGVHLVQGYLLGKPRIAELAPPAGVPRSSAA